VPNTGQAERWDGDLGAHWVAEADRYSRMARRFEERIVAALQPESGERVLDVGCGCGDLALAIAHLVGPAGAVLGVDLSGPMLTLATERASERGIANATFEQGDAQIHRFEPATFDAFVSRFGIMFFDDPAAAFSNLAGALRPGGRVAFTCWQDLLENEYVMVPAAAALEHVPFPELGEEGPGPFSLADPERLRGILERAGLAEVSLEAIHEPMWMGSSASDVVEFFHKHELAEILFRDVPDEIAHAAWLNVAAALKDHETPEGIVLSGRAWLVTARRP
jgi:SAM-dependent methyltransferase